MSIASLPKYTRCWKEDCEIVAAFITANPGHTSRLISHYTNIPHRKVCKILYHDSVCKGLALDGLVPVVDAPFKDRWYNERMTNVPLVPASANLIPVEESGFEEVLEEIDDNPISEQARTILRKTVSAMLNPTNSVRKRRAQVEEVGAEVTTMALGYNEAVKETTSTREALDQLSAQVRLLTHQVTNLVVDKPTPPVDPKKKPH